MDFNDKNVELNEEELKNVLAGNTEGMSEQFALEHAELFRTSQIEKLQEEYQQFDEDYEEEKTRKPRV